MIKAGQYFYITNNIRLACALITMGHNFRDEESTYIEENGKTEVNFIFDDLNGSVSADAKKWNDGIDKMEKEEPLAFLWAYSHNRERLLDSIKKAVPLVRVRYGEKMILYPKNATAEHKRKLMSKL